MMHEPLPEVISHCRILRRLAAGGMSEGYQAEDTKLDRKVAIEVLPAVLMVGDSMRKNRGKASA